MLCRVSRNGVSAAWHQTCQLMTVSVFLHIDHGVILIGDVNTTYHCLIPTQMKDCQVSKWFVGYVCIRISRIFKCTSTSGGK